MQKYLYITGDCNDADYTYKLNLVSEEQLQDFMPLIEAIKACPEDYNWPEEEYDGISIQDLYPQFSVELLEDFSSFTPVGDSQSGQGIHTIESIQVLDVVKNTFLIGEE